MSLTDTANKTISAFQATPVLLLVVVLNVLFAAGLGYFMITAEDNNRHFVELLLKQCGDHPSAPAQP